MEKIRTVQLSITVEKVGTEEYRAWAGENDGEMTYTGDGCDVMGALKALAEDLASSEFSGMERA